MKDSSKKPKIVKIEKPIEKPIELNERQLELKKKFADIDKRVEELEEVVASVYNDNNDIKLINIFCRVLQVLIFSM